jgi:amino acid adenylation domain-containing protein
VLELDAEEPGPCNTDTDAGDPAVEVGAEHLAYVMYTSGSTGQPKGVAVPHRAVLRLLCGIDYAELDDRQVFLWLAPLAFDASTFELWGALLHGGRCVIHPERMPSLLGLGRAIAEHGVNTLWLTAALFNSIIDQGPEVLLPVCQLLTGGEALSPAHVCRALAHLPHTRLINGYGPTEATTFTCCQRIPPDLAETASTVPIGRPIANTRVHVLDEYMNPVPVGIPGELYIGGDGLARGYVNRPELTTESFVPDPFERGGRLYRSGDRVRYLPDGSLEFLGRLDDQVKVRGFRIEPGEIEAALTAHPAVREAVVLARGEGEKRLVAYVVTDAGPAPDADALRAFLKGRLPDYMLPSAIIGLGSMPLTPNGKVDRAALPPDEPERPRAAFVGPRDIIEVQLTRIWERLLERFPVGMEDDFFDLGGNSLLALQVVDQVRQLFDRVLQVDTLWHDGRTIAGLAGLLRDQTGESIWARAVPIRAQGSRRHLFCPHIAGGHIYYYDNLARHLDPDHPIYGLPARGTDGRRSPHDTTEAIAAHCTRLMREVQPNGPYALLGYCSGGVFAFEMAQQLRQQGEEIALLALIDSESPDLSRQVRWIFTEALRDRNLRYAQERLYALALNAVGLPQLRKLKGIGEAHRWALWSYKPSPYDGSMTLFRPIDYEHAGDPTLGWRRLAKGGVRVHLLPGRHGDLVKEPGVRGLAAELEQCLNASS